MRSHVRKITKGWRKLGCKVRHLDRKAPGHLTFEVTLPDGRVKRVPMSSSPKNEAAAVRSAIVQIQKAIDGKDVNI